LHTKIKYGLSLATIIDFKFDGSFTGEYCEQGMVKTQIFGAAMQTGTKVSFLLTANSDFEEIFRKGLIKSQQGQIIRFQNPLDTQLPDEVFNSCTFDEEE
jgi:hypothetical protein